MLEHSEPSKARTRNSRMDDERPACHGYDRASGRGWAAGKTEINKVCSIRATLNTQLNPPHKKTHKRKTRPNSSEEDLRMTDKKAQKLTPNQSDASETPKKYAKKNKKRTG